MDNNGQQSTTMTFWDSGPVIALRHLLFDIVGALILSWLPRLHPLSKATEVLRGVSDKLGEVAENVESMKNVVQDPDPAPHESIMSILSDVRTELRRSTNATLEQTKVLKTLATRREVADVAAG